ncbi:MAG: hypothetical protein WBG11_06575 [Methylocella sp.]
MARQRDWFLPVEAGFGYFAGSPSGKRLPCRGSRLGSERGHIIDLAGAPKGNRTPVFAVKGRYLKFIIVRDGPQLSLKYKILLFIEFNIVRD